MPNTKILIAPHPLTGVTLHATVKHLPTGTYLDDADGAFRASPADAFVPATEDSVQLGSYILNEARTVWTDGEHLILWYLSTDHSTPVAQGELEILGDIEVAQSFAESAAVADAVLDEPTQEHTTPGSLGDATNRLLGLCLDNHVEDNIVRDGDGNKLSSTLYFYDSAANATLHDGTGLLGKTNITATYAAGLMTLLKGLKA